MNGRWPGIGIPRAAVLWTPANASPTFWVDASFASSITLVGSKVSQWNSRGVQAVNAVQGNSGSQPTYVASGLNGLGLVSLSGNTGNMVATGISWQPRTAAIYFVWLCRYNLSGNIFDPSPIVATVGNGGLPYDRHSNVVNRDNAADSGAIPFPVDQSWCLVADGCDDVGNNAFEFLNGVSRNTPIKRRGSATPSAAVQLGRRADGATLFNGDLAEAFIIEVPGQAVSTALAATCEGYLAHKWGLTSLLPSGHPYKSAPPTV